MPLPVRPAGPRVVPLVSLGHSYVQTLHPLLYILVTFGLECIGLVLGEDFERLGDVAVSFPHRLHALNLTDWKCLMLLKVTQDT